MIEGGLPSALAGMLTAPATMSEAGNPAGVLCVVSVLLLTLFCVLLMRC